MERELIEGYYYYFFYGTGERLGDSRSWGHQVFGVFWAAIHQGLRVCDRTIPDQAVTSRLTALSVGFRHYEPLARLLPPPWDRREKGVDGAVNLSASNASLVFVLALHSLVREASHGQECMKS